MAVPLSTSDDWYCTKERVAHLLKRQASEVDDIDMDIGYKWVNSELKKEKVDPTADATIIAELQADENLEAAMTNHVCYVMTRVIASHQNPGRIIPDADITSQTFGQGDVTLGYKPAEPTEHYEEYTTPNFYMEAQRYMKAFFDNLTDALNRQKRSLIAVGNTLYKDLSVDYNNRHWQRTLGRRR